MGHEHDNTNSSLPSRLREVIAQGGSQFQQAHLAKRLDELRKLLEQVSDPNSLEFQALFAAAQDGLLRELFERDLTRLTHDDAAQLSNELMDAPARRLAKRSAEWAVAAWVAALSDSPDKLDWLPSMQLGSASWRLPQARIIDADAEDEDEESEFAEVRKLRHFSARFIRVDGRNKSLRTVTKSLASTLDLLDLAVFDEQRPAAALNAIFAGKSFDMLSLADRSSNPDAPAEAGSRGRTKIDPDSPYGHMHSNALKLSGAALGVKDETGSSQLYLGYPWLSGVCSDPSRTFLQAPVLLYPVNLLRVKAGRGKTKRDGWELAFDDTRDVIFNETLVRGLMQYEGAMISESALESLADPELRDAFPEHLRSIFVDELRFGLTIEEGALTPLREYRSDEIPREPVSQFTLHQHAVVGLFPQTSSAIRADYDAMVELARDNPAKLPETVRMLLEEQEEAELVEPDALGEAEDEDASVSAETTADSAQSEASTPPSKSDFGAIHPILPIDSSQESVIARSAKAERLVVYGPPGTGKSQVISNIIADALARGEKVLLCCQKRAALDVVFERLDAVGLGHRLALVHHYSADRKAFYSHLNGALAALAQGPRNSADQLRELESRRAKGLKQLSKLESDFDQLHAALSSQRQCGFSASQLYAQLAQRQRVPDAIFEHLRGIAKSLTRFDLDEVCGRFASLDDLNDRIGSPDHPWAQRVPFTQGEADEKEINAHLVKLNFLALTCDEAREGWDRASKGAQLPSSRQLADMSAGLATIAGQKLPPSDTPLFALVRETLRYGISRKLDVDTSALEKLVTSAASMDASLARASRDGLRASPSSNHRDFVEYAGNAERDAHLTKLAALISPSLLPSSASQTTVRSSQELDEDEPFKVLIDWINQPLLTRSLQEVAALDEQLAAAATRTETDQFAKRNSVDLTSEAQRAEARSIAGCIERVLEKRISFSRFWSASYRSDAKRVAEWCEAKGVGASVHDLRSALRNLRGIATWPEVDASAKGMTFASNIHMAGTREDINERVKALRDVESSIRKVLDAYEGRTPERWLARWLVQALRALDGGEVVRIGARLSAVADVLVALREHWGRVCDVVPPTFRDAIAECANPKLAAALMGASVSMPQAAAKLNQAASNLPSVVSTLSIQLCAQSVGLVSRSMAKDLSGEEVQSLCEGTLEFAQHAESCAHALGELGTSLCEAILASFASVSDSVDAISERTSEVSAAVAQGVAMYSQLNLIEGLSALLMPTTSRSEGDGVDLLALKERASHLRSLAEASQQARAGIDALSPWLADAKLNRMRELLSEKPAELKKVVSALLDHTHHLRDLASFDATRAALDEGSAHVLRELIGSSTAEPWSDIVREGIVCAWIDDAEAASPLLTQLRPGALEEDQRKLASLIEELREINLEHLKLTLRERALGFFDSDGDRMLSDLGERRPPSLRRLVEDFAKHRHAPLIDDGKPLLDLMPCWLVSPETLSAVFPLKERLFDLIIFDEASQCTVEQALPALYRCKRCVIAGDEKQLQPGDVFRSSLSASEVDPDDPALRARSILALAKRCFESTTLRWHYRSRHEELIAFSNAAFYESQLLTVPSRERSEGSPALQWIHVPEGKWLKTKNKKEAERVLDVLFDCVKSHPGAIPGIITFNKEQQDLIAEMIDARCNDDDDFGKLILPLTAAGGAQADEALFVRNIENVQGDERDIIIFSVGYGPDAQGKVKASFGSLNRAGGENRLNVAITRARQKIVVVSSVEPHQLNVAGTRNDGPKLLRAYLEFVQAASAGEHETARMVLARVSALRQRSQHDDRVEQSALGEAIEAAVLGDPADPNGWLVDADVGASTFQVDYAVALTRADSEYRVAIETDGRHYAALNHVREREAYRPALLEAKGWKRHRIWSRAWHLNASAEHERLWRVLKEAAKGE